MVFIAMDATEALKTLQSISGENLQKDLRAITWATGKAAVRFTAQEVVKELTGSTQSQVKKQIKAQNVGPTTIVRLKKGDRFSLKRFKPVQKGRSAKTGKRLKRTGVSYKISKKEGKKTIPEAFIVHKLGGHVFKRSKTKKMKGKNKWALIRLDGPLFAGVMSKGKRTQRVVKLTNDELKKQMQKRITFRRKKLSGVALCGQ